MHQIVFVVACVLGTLCKCLLAPAFSLILTPAAEVPLAATPRVFTAPFHHIVPEASSILVSLAIMVLTLALAHVGLPPAFVEAAILISLLSEAVALPIEHGALIARLARIFTDLQPHE